MITRIFVVAAFLCCLIAVSGKHQGKTHNKKVHHGKKSVGKNDLIDGNIDYDNVSPKDCASYLCADDVDLATEYIESGCPGAFAHFEPMEGDMQGEGDMEELAVGTHFEESGVPTSTLLGLAAACGIFSAGIGFLAGYKASPSFAYMRIPSLV